MLSFTKKQPYWQKEEDLNKFLYLDKITTSSLQIKEGRLSQNWKPFSRQNKCGPNHTLTPANKNNIKYKVKRN